MLPKNATLKKVTYKSANTKIATVNKTTGKVKGIKVGSTKITVSAVDGSKRKLTIKVNVVDGSEAEPTDEPTVAPTGDPTNEPTEAPTGEPTDNPTAEPSTEPTTEPTDTPSPGFTYLPPEQGYPSGPSASSPTPAPFTTPVEGTKDEDGNTTFELDEDTDYLIKAVVDGEKIEIQTNDGTFSFIDKALKGLDTDKTLEEIYNAFFNKGTMGGALTYTPAEGVAVSIQKEPGTDVAKLTISGMDGGMSGKYSLELTKMNNGSLIIDATKDADNYFGAVVGKNADGSYGFTDIVGIQDGKKTGLLALLGDEPELKATSSAGGSKLSILTEYGELLLNIGSDGKVAMKFPDEYMKKYQIEIFK